MLKRSFPKLASLTSSRPGLIAKTNSLPLDPPKGSSKRLAVFVCLYIFVILNQAYFQKIFEVSEAREGVVVREILQYDTWITPLRHGEVFPSKPPLFHWITASLSHLFSGLTHFTLRLPSIIGGILCLLASLLILRTYQISTFAKYLSLGMLTSSYCFLQLSIDGRVDMLFNGIVLLTIAYAAVFLERFKQTTKGGSADINAIRLNEYIFISLLIGLSMLTKGPFGAVLIALGIAPIYLRHLTISELPNLLLKHRGIVIWLPLAILGSWYLLNGLNHSSGVLSKQLFFENFARFFGGSNIPSKPISFYLVHFWSQSTPWGILIFPLGILAFRNKDAIKTHPNFVLVKQCFLQALVILIFISFASGKRRAYLAPLLPFFFIGMALLIEMFNGYIQEQISKHFYQERIAKIILKLSFICSVFLANVIVFKCLLTLINIENPVFLQGLRTLSFTPILLMGLTSIICYFHIRRCLLGLSVPLSTIYYTLGILCLQLFLTFPGPFFLVKGETHSYYAFAKELQLKLPTNTELSFIKKRSDESFDTLFFYYGSRINLHPLSPPKIPGLYLVRRSWFYENKDAFPKSTYVLFEGGRPRDPEEKELLVLRISNA